MLKMLLMRVMKRITSVKDIPVHVKGVIGVGATVANISDVIAVDKVVGITVVVCTVYSGSEFSECCAF